MWKRACPRCEDSIRPRVHVHGQRFKNYPFPTFGQGTSNVLYILLISSGFQAIALFNADQHEEAMLLVQQLATACPKDDTLACHVVEVRYQTNLDIMHRC
jgi:hypothetical protein